MASFGPKRLRSNRQMGLIFTILLAYHLSPATTNTIHRAKRCAQGEEAVSFLNKMMVHVESATSTVYSSVKSAAPATPAPTTAAPTTAAPTTAAPTTPAPTTAAPTTAAPTTAAPTTPAPTTAAPTTAAPTTAAPTTAAPTTPAPAPTCPACTCICNPCCPAEPTTTTTTTTTPAPTTTTTTTTTTTPAPTTTPAASTPCPVKVAHTLDVMTSVTDKLATVSSHLKEDNMDLTVVTRLLASAGKDLKECDREVIEHVEVTQHFDFIDSALSEFIQLEIDGMLESEESAMNAIVGHKSLITICENYASSTSGRK